MLGLTLPFFFFLSNWKCNFSSQSVSKETSIPLLPTLKWIWNTTISTCTVYTIRTGKEEVAASFFMLLMVISGILCIWMALRKHQTKNWCWQYQCQDGGVNFKFVKVKTMSVEIQKIGGIMSYHASVFWSSRAGTVGKCLIMVMKKVQTCWSSFRSS